MLMVINFSRRDAYGITFSAPKESAVGMAMPPSGKGCLPDVRRAYGITFYFLLFTCTIRTVVLRQD